LPACAKAMQAVTLATLNWQHLQTLQFIWHFFPPIPGGVAEHVQVDSLLIAWPIGQVPQPNPQVLEAKPGVVHVAPTGSPEQLVATPGAVPKQPALKEPTVA